MIDAGIDPGALPYRPNVGAALFNHQGQVFIARRADMPNAEGAAGGWQLPQGGISTCACRRCGGCPLQDRV